LCQLSLCQQHQLDLFASDEHVTLEIIWSIYQNMADTYREPVPRARARRAWRV